MTLVYLALIVLIPLAALIVRRRSELGWQCRRGRFEPRVLASLRLSFGIVVRRGRDRRRLRRSSIAWALTRYDFPGRRSLDAMVDLPFALPTAVAGIALSTLYAPNGWIGALLRRLGLKVAYHAAGASSSR